MDSLKNKVQANNISFEEINVAKDDAKRRFIADKTGQLGVPVIEIDGQFIVGYHEDELKKALKIK